ncbi:MAG: AAA family ATPase, partial [Microscillaceae bacterium]|nr:AAA family ATPase [Microscillaceae bacterium]
MKTNQKIPYGISDFEKLITQNCYFSDNTPYIELLENMGESYLFFFRPRRFGKSLFLSMLSYYYGIQHKDKFEALFGAQYIGKHPTPLANQYAVLVFNFSGIDTTSPDKTHEAFLESIKISIEKFIEEYLPNITKEDLNEILSKKSPASVINKFFKYCKHLKIYLLIDEYDHFTNEILAYDFGQFKEIVTGDGYVRKFYEIIKNATWEGIVDRILMMGVTPVTLDSLTSGFNIGLNISDTLVMHEMLGFTHVQVEELVEAFIKPDTTYKAFMMSELKKWYNGYKFTKKAKQLLYNPDMVLYFLSRYQLQQDFPDKMLDTNIASDYGKMKNIFRIKNPEQNDEVLKDIVEGKDLYAMLTQQF